MGKPPANHPLQNVGFYDMDMKIDWGALGGQHVGGDVCPPTIWEDVPH